MSTKSYWILRKGKKFYEKSAKKMPTAAAAVAVDKEVTLTAEEAALLPLPPVVVEEIQKGSEPLAEQSTIRSVTGSPTVFSFKMYAPTSSFIVELLVDRTF